MISTTGFIGPFSGLLDTFITDPKTRDAAKMELLRLAATASLEPPPFSPALAPALEREAASPDPWTSRARPTFLYVMYVMLLWSIPMGLIAAVRPAVAHDIAAGMTAYLAGIPEPLYALFGTGYLGYTVARSWGKRKGVES